jgi:hypothetical protein
VHPPDVTVKIILQDDDTEILGVEKLPIHVDQVLPADDEEVKVTNPPLLRQTGLFNGLAVITATGGFIEVTVTEFEKLEQPVIISVTLTLYVPADAIPL